MKESGKMRLKSTINESTLSTAGSDPLRVWGRRRSRWSPFPYIVKANTGYVEKKNNDGHSLPRVGKVASKASRIGFWRYEREGESSKADDSRKHPLQKQLIKPIYSYKKRKSNAANDFNVIDRFGHR